MINHNMNMGIRRAGYRSLFLALCFIGIAASEGLAQFNVKIGYSLARVSPEVSNQILAVFNEQQELFFDDYVPMADLKWVNGVGLGARYRVGGSSLELSWENLSRDRELQGINQTDVNSRPVSLTREFQYSFNMFMLTFETKYDMFGIGSAIGRNFVSLSEETTNGTGKSRIISRNADAAQTFARFHLSFNFSGSGTVAFAIKPYIQIPLSKVDISSMASYLDVSQAQSDESYPMFGLSFNFYNGRQE